MDRIRAFFPKTDQTSLLTPSYVSVNVAKYELISLNNVPVNVAEYKSISLNTVSSKWNLGTSIFNWNNLYGLQRNTNDFYFCLICYQLHWKVHEVSTLRTFFRVPLAFERYHLYSGCDHGISLNILQNAWINGSDYVTALNIFYHLICLTRFWRCLRL